MMNITKKIKDQTDDEKSTGYHYRQFDFSNTTDGKPYLYIVIDDGGSDGDA